MDRWLMKASLKHFETIYYLIMYPKLKPAVIEG
jgi:hypothetical protein